MATITTVLRKKKNRHGEYPLALRLTKDRATAFLHLGYHIEESQWNAAKGNVKKSHPNSTRLNNLITKKVSDLSEKCLELEARNPSISAKEIMEGFDGKTSKDKFFKVAQEYLDNLEKGKKFTQLSANKPRVKHFREFLKGKDISFDEISVGMLRRFGVYLKAKRNVSERTVMNHYVVIRSIFKIGMENGVVQKDNYPFGKGKILIRFPKSLKIGLTKTEVSSLENLDLEIGSSDWHAKNLWLLSYYFAGMRVADVIQLKWSDISDGRLYYQMDKNNKPGSMKLVKGAQEIVSFYSDRKEKGKEYIFPFLDGANLKDPRDIRRKVDSAKSLSDKHLKGVAKKAKIKKSLSMHMARHTFGNISGDKIPIQMLQKLYRHSSVLTTIGYQSNFVFKDTDEALESVIEG